MAAWRKPGPIGTDGEVVDVNDGTLVRNLSPLPGACGHQATAGATHEQISFHRQRQSRKGLPILREGVSGPHVRWAQILLNQHGAANPPLRVDGAFGPQTLTAVRGFQRGSSLSPDGVVGMQTWVKLVVGASPQVSRGRHDFSAHKPELAAQPGTVSVADWPLTQRFEKVLRLAPQHMAPELATQFRAMLTPGNIAIAAGTLAVWAVSQAFGVGEVVDAILLFVGAAFIGLGIFKAGEDLGDCLVSTLHAQGLPDLDRAADYLAQAVVILGVTTFFALLAKMAGSLARGGGAAEEEAAGSSGSAAAGDAAPKPPSTPQPPKPRVAEERPAPIKSPTESQLDAMYAKAPAAKGEIDALAARIATETGGKVAKAPLKGRERALEKAINDYGGDATRIKDIARNTIVVEADQYDKAIALLKGQGAKVKNIAPSSNPMGYSGANAIIGTKVGVPAEIQVNTPEMIYAKESPAAAKAILGEEKYAELASRTGVPGGRGHQLYEEYRSLPDGDPRAVELEAQSQAYYDHVRKAGGR